MGGRCPKIRIPQPSICERFPEQEHSAGCKQSGKHSSGRINGASGKNWYGCGIIEPMRLDGEKGWSMTSENERAFSFIELNKRDPKPRKAGITEIRGPYYTPMGRNYLETSWEP